ncbi:MAG: hypothetical protein H3C35_08400 [Bacteroidetes bacterium]|nr:hypothetical protein [Bacteroidota bacterium]
MIIRDKRGGLVFVRKFEGRTETIYFSLGYKDGELIQIPSNEPRNNIIELLKKLEKSEVLFLDYTLPSSDEPSRHSAAHSVGLLKFDSNVRSDSDTVNPEGVNELWGEFISIGKTRVRKIRYKVEGFEIAIDDGDFALKDYSEIDEYRKGVLMQ